MTVVHRAVADLQLVAKYLPGLIELRDPTVFAPRPPSLITPERRAELDFQARLERSERDGIAPGEHVDAARVEILDILITIEDEAFEIADTIAWDLVRPPWLPHIRRQQRTAHHLEFAINHLADTDELTTSWAAARAAGMVRQLSRALCFAHDGQTLQAICPWCRGGLDGSGRWRVRQLPGDEIAIVCESDVPCEPPSKDVGTWWRGRPVWPFREWEWLAKRLQSVDEISRMSA